MMAKWEKVWHANLTKSMASKRNSLNWTTVVPDGIPTVHMIRDQRLDEAIMPIIIAVQEGKRPPLQEIVNYGPRTRTLWHQFDTLKIEGQLLWRRFEHPSGIPEEVFLVAWYANRCRSNHFWLRTVQTRKWSKPEDKGPVKAVQRRLATWSVACWCRRTPNPVHGFSPYEVMFGAPMRTPLALTREAPPKLPDMGNFPYQVRKGLIEIHEQVRKMSNEARQRRKGFHESWGWTCPWRHRRNRFKGSAKEWKSWSGKWSSHLHQCWVKSRRERE